MKVQHIAPILLISSFFNIHLFSMETKNPQKDNLLTVTIAEFNAKAPFGRTWIQGLGLKFLKHINDEASIVNFFSETFKGIIPSYVIENHLRNDKGDKIKLFSLLLLETFTFNRSSNVNEVLYLFKQAALKREFGEISTYINDAMIYIDGAKRPEDVLVPIPIMLQFHQAKERLENDTLLN